MALTQLCLELAQGRISLTLYCQRMGQDVQICLTGGTAHLGAVALALPDAPEHALFVRPGHREDVLAVRMAQEMAQTLGCAVCVSAGIHYPNITREEIGVVEHLAQKLTAQCLQALAPTNEEP